MARNTLEAVFGALGAGLTGYGRDAARRREEEQTRLDRERQADRDRLAMFEAGLEPSADVQGRRQRLTQATQATQAMAGAPMPGMSAVGPALAAATRAMGEDVDRGRRITIGGTEYVQPFSRTLEGREQEKRTREAQQAELTRQRQMVDVESERSFQRERDNATRRFNAVQNQLDREARMAMSTAPSTAVRPPTEAQERNAVYYGLMSNAARELDALRDNPNIRPWFITTYLNTPGATFGRGILNDAEQQFIRAAQDFTAGVLRKETGAAATKSEIAITLDRYIEMGGDGEGTRQAKSDARNRITSMMELAATPALRYQQMLAGQPAADARQERLPLSNFWEE